MGRTHGFSRRCRSGYRAAVCLQPAVLIISPLGLCGYCKRLGHPCGVRQESGNLTALNRVASLLVDETTAYQQQLKSALSRGLSYPAARACAVKHILHDDSPEMSSLLSGPNNILAIEYLRVIKEFGLKLIPVTYARRGATYHDLEVSELASATAIRHAIYQGLLNQIPPALPEASLNILQEEVQAGRAPIPVDGLELAILIQLRLATKERLQEVYEINEGLENRLLTAARQWYSS